MLGSVVLHATVAVALLISWNFARDLKVGSVVPVTIVSQAPATDVRKAEQAPVEQTAQADEPVPEAPLESTPPAPQPKPAPPPPTPKPTPLPAKPVPAPVAKPAPPAKPEKSLDLDALSASISKLQKPATPKPSSAAKGPARPETAQQARPALGAGISAAALSGLTDELQRRWNPNCDVEGGRDVKVQVVFVIGAGAQVAGDVASKITRGGQTPVSRTAAERAVSAVYAAAPFRNLPREFYGERITVNFDAREACS